MTFCVLAQAVALSLPSESPFSHLTVSPCDSRQTWVISGTE